MHLHAKSSASGAERKCPTTKQNASPSKKNILTPVPHHPPHLHPKDHGAQPQPPCTNHQGRGPGPDTQTSGLSKAARVKPCSAIPITAQPGGLPGGGAGKFLQMRWIHWKAVFQQTCSSSAIAVTETGLGLILRVQVGKSPEGHEKETPASAPKVQTGPLDGD